ncbi:MAG: peptidylprolyl isomerase, partial [bacterium]|nr:peptidylprolyl isomerase [bacterium]
CLTFFLVAGCKKEKKLTDAQLDLMPDPQTTGLPPISGGMVIAIENEAVTSDEVISTLADVLRQPALNSDFETYKKQARPLVEQFVNNKISSIIVYKHAKRDAGDQIDDKLNEVVETEIKNFLAGFGGDYAKAEDALKKDGFNSWQEFRDFQKRLILSQSYLSAKMPQQQQPVTYKELLDIYNRDKKNKYTTAGKITFQLIDIQPAKLNSPDPNKTKLHAARELADDLIKKIKSGEDFANLARQYSNDPFSEFGGIWKPVEPNSLAKPYDILAKQAQNLSPGRIAGPIETDEHIFIMKLLDKQNESIEPFEKVQGEIRKRILVERQRKTYYEINEKIVQQASIANKDDFVDYCLAKIYEINNKLAGNSQ